MNNDIKRKTKYNASRAELGEFNKREKMSIKQINNLCYEKTREIVVIDRRL